METDDDPSENIGNNGTKADWKEGSIGKLSSPGSKLVPTAPASIQRSLV